MNTGTLFKIISYIWSTVHSFILSSPAPLDEDQEWIEKKAEQIENRRLTEQCFFTSFRDLQHFIDTLLHSIIKCNETKADCKRIIHLSRLVETIIYSLNLGLGSFTFHEGDRVRFFSSEKKQFIEGIIREIPNDFYGNFKIEPLETETWVPFCFKTTYSISRYSIFKLDEDQHEVPK